MSQKLVPKTQEELGTETKEQRDINATVRKIDDDGVTVDVTTAIMRAEATLLQENGEERKVLDFSEEEQRSSHTVPSEKSIYADVAQTDYWKIVEDLRGHETTAASVQRDFTAWDILSLMPTPVLTAAVETSSAAYEPLTVPEEHTVSQDTITQIDTDVQRFFGLDSLHTSTIMEDVEYAVSPHVTYDPDQTPSRTAFISAPANIVQDNNTITEAVTTIVEPEHDAYLAPEQLENDSDTEHGRITFIEYDAPQEDGVQARLTYQVDDELASNATVKETLLDLVEHGELDATIVKQPFYSPESFDDGENYHNAGWQHGFYGVVQMEGMDLDVTEFSINGELAMDGIDSLTVNEGDYIEFETSEAYACGASTNIEEHQEAWQERYSIDIRNELTGATERGVYAAMVEGRSFEGSSLDLSLFENARDAYIETTGNRPENVIDNVFYDTNTAA